MTKGDWSSGMIPASGAGGPEFDSPVSPSFCLLFVRSISTFWLYVYYYDFVFTA